MTETPEHEIVEMTQWDAQRLVDEGRPLPSGLICITGNLDVRAYAHPLPSGLKSVLGTLYLDRYQHPIPAGLRFVGGILWLDTYEHPIPAGLTCLGGWTRWIKRATGEFDRITAKCPFPPS